MTAVKISGVFKRDERPYNGLEAIAKELLDRGRATDRYVVVALVRPGKATWEPDDGIETPSVRIDRIEILEGADADTARELLNNAYRARAGGGADPQDTLPFDGDKAPPKRRTKDAWLDPNATQD